jgi:hypothetical protein
VRLLSLFPRRWRERYGEEFEALLEETDLSVGDLFDVLRGVWDARLRPQPHLPGLEGGTMAATRVRLRPLTVFLALLAARVVQVSLAGPLLHSLDPSVPRPLEAAGLGWLPPTPIEVAAGVALVVALSRFLRLRLVTAVVVGPCLELLIGPAAPGAAPLDAQPGRVPGAPLEPAGPSRLRDGVAHLEPGHRRVRTARGGAAAVAPVREARRPHHRGLC